MIKTEYEWAVIGAGPAGIAAVGKLLDHHIAPKSIVWIDPHFEVGDFGTKWLKVSSNTKVGLFNRFLHAAMAFEFEKCPKKFALSTIDSEATCELSIAAEPLKWVTQQLSQKVHAIHDVAHRFKLANRHWEITLSDKVISAKNVILAIGAEPKNLPYSSPHPIPLEVALNPELLQKECKTDDTVAVFGSSHSAIIILKSLLENCSVRQVINFYQSPLKYAVYLPDMILFDDTGLKGTTAQWAKENIDGKLPPKLSRIISSSENILNYLPLCNKAIHAVGFQQRMVSIDGLHDLHYNPHNGIIAPGLFGFGIGFPEAKIDRFGTKEYRVGLWKFMEYLESVLPIWMLYTP